MLTSQDMFWVFKTNKLNKFVLLSCVQAHLLCSLRSLVTQSRAEYPSDIMKRLRLCVITTLSGEFIPWW